MSMWGIFLCPKWFEILNIGSNVYIYSLSLPFILPRTRAKIRIGPHNYDILSILIGSLLGDGYAERHGHGTRFCFQQEHLNYRYLLWFHNYLSELGYSTTTIPIITTRLGSGGKLRYISRFKTYTFASFNWIHTAFYKNGIKVIPIEISDYLSPLALAVWIMDDGGKISSGLKIATNSFSKSEVEYLATLLRNNYGLKVSVISAGYINQYNLYFSKSSMKILAQIVKPYLHTSMFYKLNGYI
jgi:ubiquinol-cytochrome c reductase cytochrome b subunit